MYDPRILRPSSPPIEARCDIGVITNDDGSHSGQFGRAAIVGNYTVKIEDAADPTVYDQSDHYFSIVEPVPPPDLPDLTVTKLKVYRIDANNVGMDFCVKNIGNVDARRFQVKFHNLDNPGWDFGGMALNLAADREWCSKSRRGGVGPDGGNGYVRGKNRIKMVVDFQNQIKEVNENNNEKVVIFDTTLPIAVGLRDVEDQLAAVSEAVSRLMESMKRFLER